MKVLIAHSYFLKLDPKQLETGRPYPPLGTLYAASVLRSRGHEVSFFDAMFAEGSQALSAPLDATKPEVLLIFDDGFNYLNKMCLTNMRQAAFQMIALGRDRQCTTIVFGSDSTDHCDLYLGRGASFVILGEAEQTLAELLEAIGERKFDFDSIPGLAFLKGEGIYRTTSRKVMKNLDLLPDAAWDLVDMNQYRKVWQASSGFFSLNMVTTRGCPFKCNWCAKPLFGNQYHARSPRRVIDELKLLKNTYGFDHIWFCDDIFGLKPGWVAEFAELVKMEGLEFRFKIQSRADLLTQRNYVHNLQRAGCEDVWMGAESGSQRILDAMDKGITVSQIQEATKLLREHSIKASFFIQFGYPGETKQDIRKTIALINRLLPDNLGISISYPLPGTAFYEKVKADLKAKSNWTDSDELMMMFRHKYTPAFYKQLHRYVHKTYRLRMGLANLKKLLLRPSSGNWVNIRKAFSISWYVPAAAWAKFKLNLLGREVK